QIAVTVTHADSRLATRLGAQADRRREAGAWGRPIVSIEPVDLAVVADDEIQIAVPVHVAEHDGPGVVGLGSDRADGLESLPHAGGISAAVPVERVRRAV